MAVTKTLSQFKSRLAGGGANNNLFEVLFLPSLGPLRNSGDKVRTNLTPSSKLAM